MDEDKHASQQRDTEPLQINGSTDQSMSPADRDLDVMRQDYLGPCISIKRERTTELEPLFSPTSSCHAHSAGYNVTSLERGWLNAGQKHLESVTAISVNGKSRENLVVGDCSLEISQSDDIPVDQGPVMIKDDSNTDTHEKAVHSLKRLLIERKKSSQIPDLMDGRVNEAEEDLSSSKQVKISHPNQRCSDCGKQLPVNSRYCGCQNKPCPKCGRSFKSEQQRTRHIQQAHTTHPFSCDVCGKTFTTNMSAKEHYLSHSSRPYVCAKCGKSFVAKRYLKKHFLHSACGKSKYVDRQAAAEINPSVDVRLEKHNESTPDFVTLFLGRQQMSSDATVKGETTKTSNSPVAITREKTKKCDGPVNPSPSRQHLSRAVKEKKTASYADEDLDSDEEGRVIDEDFDSDDGDWSDERDGLTNNSDVPTDDQPISDVPARAQAGGHVCSRCGHSFLSSYALIRHIQEVHFDLRPYLCSICQMSYKRIDHLNNHMASHSLELPLYQCGRCGQSFGLKRDLSLHMAGHSEDNLYILNSQGQLENTKSQTSLQDIGHSSMSSSDSCMENDIRTPESSDLGNIEPRSLTSCEATEQSVLSQAFSTSVHHIIENDSGLEDGVVHSTPSKNVRINSGDVVVVSEPYSCSTCDKDHCDSHITTHRAGKPYNCANCGECFGVAGNLQQHVYHSSCGSKLRDAGDREHHTDFSSTRKSTGTDQRNTVTFPRRRSHVLEEPSNQMTSPSPGRHSLSRAVKEKSRRSYADEESCDNDVPNSDTDFDPDNDDGTWSAKHMPDICVKTSISENVEDQLKHHLARPPFGVIYKCGYCDQAFGLKQQLDQHTCVCMVVHEQRAVILDTEECLDDSKHKTDQPVSWCSSTSTSSGQDNKSGRTKSLNFVESCGLTRQSKIPIRGLSVILEKLPIHVGEVVVVKSAQDCEDIGCGNKQTSGTLKIYKNASGNTEITIERCRRPEHQSHATEMKEGERAHDISQSVEGQMCDRTDNGMGNQSMCNWEFSDVCLVKQEIMDTFIKTDAETFYSHVTCKIEKPNDSCVTREIEKPADSCVTSEIGKPTDSCVTREIEKQTDSCMTREIEKPADSRLNSETEKSTDSLVTSGIEKPTNSHVSSEIEKLTDRSVTSEIEKPTNSCVTGETEKPSAGCITSKTGEPYDSCVTNKIKKQIDTKFTFEMEELLCPDTSEIHVEESSDSCVTSEMDIHLSTYSCVITITEEPSDSGVPTESRKPSPNQVIGSSETLSSAEPSPVRSSDPSESLVDSGRQHLPRMCKQTESVSYSNKMTFSAEDDSTDDGDDKDWTDEGDTNDSNNKVTSDAINNRHCSRCGKHYPENGTDHCDCQESTDNQDGDNEPIKPHETRSGPSDWGRTGIPDKPCPKCDEVFVTESYLRIHMSKVHTEGKPSHLCSTCGKRLTSKERLREHMRFHSDDRPFLCAVCGKSFKSSTCLCHHNQDVHMINGRRKKQVPLVYGCSTCGAKFSHRPALREHTNTYKGHVPKNQCFLCGRIFGGPTSLEKHLQMHQTGKPFKCNHCDQSFEFAGRLEQHMVKHKTVRDKVCPQCNKGFKLDKLLRRHINSVHSTEPPSFLCTICGKALKLKVCLDSHMTIMHPADGVERRPFKCDTCGKTFKCKGGLTLHLKRHLPLDPKHKCTLCHKQLKNAVTLQSHMLCHTDEAPLECKFCGKKFKRSCNLNSHVRIHTGERIFKCDICDQAFKWAHILRNHMKRHNLKQ